MSVAFQTTCAGAELGSTTVTLAPLPRERLGREELAERERGPEARGDTSVFDAVI